MREKAIVFITIPSGFEGWAERRETWRVGDLQSEHRPSL